MVSSSQVRWPIVILATVSILLVFGLPLVFPVPFRLDDVLFVQWAQTHSFWSVFDPVSGQVVNSFRPIMSITIWCLTHLAGLSHPVYWHFTLVITLVIGLVFAAKFTEAISNHHVALVIVPLLYLVVFAKILNVFFWFSDLTFGLELCFTMPALYFGSRAMLDGKLKVWLLAMVLSVLAVLSKEPAIIIINVVLIGILLLNWSEVRTRWAELPSSRTFIAVLTYIVFLLACAFIAFASPTRSNRLLAFGQPNLLRDILERLHYYSPILSSHLARVAIFFPILFVASFQALRGRLADSRLRYSLLAIIVLIASLLFLGSPIIALLVITGSVLFIVRSGATFRQPAKALLPLVVTVCIAFGALLFTIQIVKTQLTEIAFLLSIVGAWGWIETGRILSPMFSPYRRIIVAGTVVVFLGAIALGFPIFTKQVRMLRAVADVRWNANDAVRWAARSLPPNSTFAVTTYELSNVQNANNLTSTSDDTKLRMQSTFDGGYVYLFLDDLGRSDIQKAFLADSALLPQVLDAMRREPSSYLFVQTELDHRILSPQLRSRDTLVASFDRPPYSTQIWKLRD